MSVVGHALVREQLEPALPPVVLLQGPPSVGKRTLALHLVKHHGCIPADLQLVPRLSVDESRSIRAFVSRAPMGPFKAVVTRLDGASSPALNALLKVLEEPPSSCRFILLSAARTLDTITSRAMTFRMGLLSETEVLQVLTQRLGMELRLAQRAVKFGHGQVGAAMEAGELELPRAAVLSVLKAVADRDVDLLDAALVKWDDVSHSLLVTWATEATTTRWRVFTESETFGLHRSDVPLQLLRGLSLQARPRLAARVVLESIVRHKEQHA